MGFRHVEPEPREPQPAVPLRWVALGTVGLLALSMLPVFFGLILGFVSVLDTRHQDSPVVVEAREFHHEELEPKRRVYPEYPEAAKPLNLAPQRCLAVVSMDEEGTPHDVRVDNCPAVFVPPTREAMLKWRWYPPEFEGRAVPAKTTIAVTYKMKDEVLPTPSVSGWTDARDVQRNEARIRLEQRRVERIAEAEAEAQTKAAAAYGETDLSGEDMLYELGRRVRPTEHEAGEPVRLELDLPED